MIDRCFRLSNIRRLAVLLALPLYGCVNDIQGDLEQQEEVDPLLAENGLQSINGLGTINGLATHNGLTTTNGLATHNGLATSNGLATINGLATHNGLMTFAGGRTMVKYLAKCALPMGQTLIKQDQNGVTYSFPGGVGAAPIWLNGSCDAACQEKITSCLMSLTNFGGRHVAVELVSAAAGLAMIGPNGDDINYPNQEGAVFGNLFVSPPKMFTCTGTESPKAEQVKRYCIDGTDCTLFAKAGSCASACTQTCTVGPGGKNKCSATSCKDPSGKTWTNPITVFLRNKMEAANFDGQSGGVTSFGLGSSGGITGLDNNEWVQMNDVQFGTQAGAIKTALATIATSAVGKFIDVRLNTVTGPLLGTITTKSTGGMNTYGVQSGTLNTAGITGRHTVFFVFRGGSNIGNISYFELK